MNLLLQEATLFHTAVALEKLEKLAEHSILDGHTWHRDKQRQTATGSGFKNGGSSLGNTSLHLLTIFAARTKARRTILDDPAERRKHQSAASLLAVCQQVFFFANWSPSLFVTGFF